MQSYVTRDVNFPDTNRFYYTEEDDSAPNARLETNVAAVEWARHRAWITRAKLNWIINNMPYNESDEAVIKHLESALFDSTDLLNVLKAGRLSTAEAEAFRDRLDLLQIE